MQIILEFIKLLVNNTCDDFSLMLFITDPIFSGILTFIEMSLIVIALLILKIIYKNIKIWLCKSF